MAERTIHRAVGDGRGLATYEGARCLVVRAGYWEIWRLFRGGVPAGFRADSSISRDHALAMVREGRAIYPDDPEPRLQ